ncbi:MAG: copper homeostasis protein CutC [bacterium]|nr:copper homeostasis protein CutC [bacterium]
MNDAVKQIQIEVCVGGVDSAIEAQRGGADRVELCDNLMEGGTTPSAGAIAVARQRLALGLMVMIRPRGGDFYYSDEEFEMMRRDVQIAQSLGADGVVFGLLTPDGLIDAERMRELIDLARPMSVTCHRAFDMTLDPQAALETLIGLGVNRVLTSGQRDSVPQGAELLAELVKQANERIIIMPGCGINEDNLSDVIRMTGALEYHVSCRKSIESAMRFRNPNVYMGTPGLPEYERLVTDASRIAEIVRVAKEEGQQ